MEDIAKWEKDFLTNCYTRNNLYQFLDTLKMESNMHKKPFSIMLVDLDHFKSMNDKHGHLFGDEALKYFSSSIRLSLETNHLNTFMQRCVFRFGGDEFLVVFPGENSHDAYISAHKILSNIKKRHFLFKGCQFKMSFSGGIATYPYDGESVDELLKSADKALYLSKGRGKGIITQHCKIKIEQFKRVVNILIAAILLLSIIALFKGLSKNFINKTKRLKQRKISNIYLKSGSNFKGIIVSDKDPMEIKLNLDKGEGLIKIYKSEISKIVPEN